jgi:hypothetical protein
MEMTISIMRVLYPNYKKRVYVLNFKGDQEYLKIKEDLIHG